MIPQPPYTSYSSSRPLLVATAVTDSLRFIVSGHGNIPHTAQFLPPPLLSSLIFPLLSFSNEYQQILILWILQIVSAMSSMEMITFAEATVLLEMARSGNEYVTAAFELYQAGEKHQRDSHILFTCISRWPPHLLFHSFPLRLLFR